MKKISETEQYQEWYKSYRNKIHRISVTFKLDEFEQVCADAENAGRALAVYIRELSLQKKLDTEQIQLLKKREEDLSEVVTILRGIGTNFNQMTYRTNKNFLTEGTLLSPEQLQQRRSDVLSHLKSLEDFIKTTYNDAPKKPQP